MGIEATLPALWFERLLVEAAQTAVVGDAELRRAYQRLKFHRVSGVAKVAIARRLAVRLYWILRARVDYAQLALTSGSPGSAVVDSNPSKL